MANKVQKTVQVIARIQFKADARKVVYLVRPSKGEGQYETHLFDGKACSCTCPSKKPCYHMTQLEAKEAARTPAASIEVTPPAKLVAEYKEAGQEKVAVKVGSHIVTVAEPIRQRSEQAQIEYPDAPKAVTFEALKRKYDCRTADLHMVVAAKVSEAKQRQSASVAEMSTEALISESKSLVETRLMAINGQIALSNEQIAEVDARGKKVATELAKRFPSEGDPQYPRRQSAPLQRGAFSLLKV